MDKLTAARRALGFALVGILGSPVAVPAEIKVAVNVTAPGAAREDPAEIILLAEPAGAGAVAAHEYPIGLGEWELDLPPGPRWRLRAQAPGFWGNTVVVDRFGGAEIVELFLWPAGVLRGSLTVTGEEGLPGEMRLDLESDVFSGDSGGVRADGVTCPVVGDEWRCEVPAGSWNLTLRAGQFIPHRRLELAVGPGQVVDLGDLRLVLGASIAGRVELGDGGAPGPDCEVRLTGSADDGGRLALAVARPGEDGLFLLEGVPPGRWVPAVSQPGYLPETGSVLAVARGETVEIPEPLVLRRPATLEVVFTPPTGAAREPWEAVLTELDSDGRKTRRSHRGEAGPDGILILEDLRPGGYELTLAQRFGNQTFSRRLELVAGGSTVPIELPVVVIEGTVSAGGEPLAARVMLRPVEGGSTAAFDSDDGGMFGGLLPHEGTWAVRVSAPQEGITADLEPVEVSARGSGVAVIDLRLPATLLEGEVTDVFGDRVGEATVRILLRGSQGVSHSVKTDSSGRFRVRGLAPGPISVMAQAGSLRSQRFELVLEDGRSVPPLQLVVR